MLSTSHDHVGISQVSQQTAKEMLAFVTIHGLEGIVAKRADSIYEPGRRTGLWVKRRLNRRQEFVIGGYVPGHLGLDWIVIGSIAARSCTMPPRPRRLCAAHPQTGLRKDQAT
jgi:hypothetical protein